MQAKGALAEEAEGKWGMVIDQDLCTGCQACVAACAMENNLSFVGEEDAGYGRTSTGSVSSVFGRVNIRK